MPDSISFEEGVGVATDVASDPNADVHSVYKILMNLPIFNEFEKSSINSMYSFISDTYEDPSANVKKGNVMLGLGKSLLRNALGMEVDPIAGQFKTSVLDYFYDNSPTKEQTQGILDMFRAYQDEYGFLDEKGVKIAEDLIMSGSLNYKFLNRRSGLISHPEETMRNRILNNPYDGEWSDNFDVTGDEEFHVTDVVKYIHGGVSEKYRRSNNKYKEGQ